ncbi:MAG: hypothetical protein ACYTG1_09830 [Planctomycetota bacterium]|jgi:hypothetical protein
MRPFPRPLVALGCLLALPAVAAAQEPPVPDPSPPCGVVVAPGGLDLGALPPDTPVAARVWLVNESLRPVTITACRPGCGCTTVPGFEPVTLAPATAVSVPVIIRSPKKLDHDKAATIRFLAAWGAPATVRITMRTDADAATPAPLDTGADGVHLVPMTGHLGELVPDRPVDTMTWVINAGPGDARVEAIKAGCGCTKAVSADAGVPRRPARRPAKTTEGRPAGRPPVPVAPDGMLSGARPSRRRAGPGPPSPRRCGTRSRGSGRSCR